MIRMLPKILLTLSLLGILTCQCNKSNRTRAKSLQTTLKGKIVFGMNGRELNLLKPNTGQIFTIHPRKLVEGKELSVESASEPCWSPDGQKIVFSSRGEDSLGSPYELKIMNSDGSDVRPFLHMDRVDCIYPCWSPDGEKIAFLAKFYDRPLPDIYRLCMADIETCSPRLVIDIPAARYRPSWSPDGEQIAFTSVNWTIWSQSGKKVYTQDVWITGVDGSNARKLTSGLAPLWSPDGSHILYKGKKHIYTITPEARDVTKVNPHLGLFARILNEEYCFPLAWSPDGQFILLTVPKLLAWPYTEPQELQVLSAKNHARVRLAAIYGIPKCVSWID